MSPHTTSKTVKRTTGLRIDPDLYDKAVEKCHRESIRLKTRVTFSSTVEALIRQWVAKNKR